MQVGDIVKQYWSRRNVEGTNLKHGWHKAVVKKIINTKQDKYKLYYIDLNVSSNEILTPSRLNQEKMNPKGGDWCFYKIKKQDKSHDKSHDIKHDKKLHNGKYKYQYQYQYGGDDYYTENEINVNDLNSVSETCPVDLESPIKINKTITHLPLPYLQKPTQQILGIQNPPQVRMIIGNLVEGDVVESIPWRRKLGEAISSGKLPIDKCNLPQWLNNFKVLGKCSASSTSVVLASTNDDNLKRGVSLKIAYKGGDDNSLDIERGFYKIYFEFIQQHFFSPNVVTFYASFTCPTAEFRKILTKENNLRNLYKENQILNKVLWDEADSEDRKTMEILVIEKTQGVTLKDCILNLTEEEWKNVLFQIIYTFEVFNRLGLRHNDAHTGNIFIDSLSGNSKVSQAIYAVNKDLIFKVNMQKMVKIFDLDLSGANCDKNDIHPAYENLVSILSNSGLCTNSKLDGGFCTEYGLCNDKNQYFDTFLTLGFIYKSLKSNGVQSKVQDFIVRNIGKDLLNANFKFPYHLGSFNIDIYNENESYIPGESQINLTMVNNMAMLNDQFFDSLRININVFKTNCTEIPVYHLPLTIKDENTDVSQPNDYWDKSIPESCFLNK